MASHEAGNGLAPALPTTEPPPLAAAKLAPPRLRAELLSRPRIDRLLDAGETAALTLVSAPPGYGKTTAVRAWCDARGKSLVWITLDRGDNDPLRLWTYVASALERLRRGLGRAALHRLAAPGVMLESVVDELANALALDGRAVVVVLDDLQTLSDKECFASLEQLIQRLPSQVRLVLITRSDPPLKLARLRGLGALVELRAGELAFTEAETRALLVEQGGLELSRDELALLLARTEGWPAALVLAALWLRTLPEPGRAVRAFGGEQRFVAEYLSEEVLAVLEPEPRAFLLRAAVLGRFTAELCDGVLGRSDSARVLADLERANLFLVRLGHGGWLRIHSLFAEFARLELAAEDPDAAVDLHRRAAAWLRERGLLAETAEHAAAAGDLDLVSELLAESQLALLRNGGSQTLLAWLGELPDEEVLRQPRLVLGAAGAALLLGRPTLERRRWLALARRAPPPSSPDLQVRAALLGAAAMDGNVGDALNAGERALALAETGDQELLLDALAVYARATYFAGDSAAAQAAALRALEQAAPARRPSGHAYARCTLALIAAERGSLATARRHAEQAKALVVALGASRSWLGANVAAALAAVLAGENRLPEAERELAAAEHFFRDEAASVYHAWLLLLLARVRCRRGRLEEAARALEAARAEVADLVDGGVLPALGLAVERELEQARRRAGDGELLAAPSDAELAVLRLLASELSAREIAKALYLSPNTVRSHTRALYRKLGVNSRAAAVARAQARGVLDATAIG